MKKLNLPKIKLPKVKLPKVKMPSVKSLISNKREKPSKPFIDDVKSIFRSYRGQMIWISVLSGFLLFLLNILIWVSMYGNTLNASLNDKLGMYFYLNDNVEEETRLYKQVIQLKDRLEKEGLKVNFLTKEDAMDFMMKRLPELTGSLEKFWMSNPLPATLYVTLPDISKYETLKEVMLENKEIIINIQDVEQLDNLESQENRIRNVIKLSNFVQILSMSLVIILAAAVLSFSIFFLRSIFTRFWNDIQVKKLLWILNIDSLFNYRRILDFIIAYFGFNVSVWLLYVTVILLYTYSTFIRKMVNYYCIIHCRNFSDCKFIDGNLLWIRF